jgi:small-conductance mechanosensitive channel
VLVYITYELIARAFGVAVLGTGGREADVHMFLGLVRAVAIAIWALGITSVFFELSLFLAALGGFAGLFLGWSLQQPVTGMAAWVMVTLKRPFRIGDRVSLPSWNLIGDVTDIGIMYTELNQVGGTVGTEEPSGRTVLVPNAILFGNVVIDYTKGVDRESSYLLDEIIIRITYDSNWDEAEKILIDSAKEVTSDVIEATKIEPYVRSDFYDYGVWMRLRYMTLATERPKTSHEINSKIFKKISSSHNVDFAIPYVYSVKKALNTGGPA